MNKTLVNAVIRRVGRDSLRDVVRGGADGGFPGFTYTRDTCAFYARHQAAIVEIVAEMADDLGESPIEMVRGFRCLHGDSTPDEIGRTLYGSRSKHDATVANALAWFALEEVARFVTESDS